jgi:hypothetical protein
MKVRLAVFKSVDCTDSETFLESWAENWDSYIRISEYVAVEFPEREKAEYIHEEIKALDKMADEIRTKATEGLNNINRRKEELLALEHKS